MADVNQPMSSSDNEDDETGKSEKRRPRNLATADFTEDQDQEMVDWSQAPEQDVLLNKRHLNYFQENFEGFFVGQLQVW